MQNLKKATGILTLVLLINMLPNYGSFVEAGERLSIPTEGTPSVDPNHGEGIINKERISILSTFYLMNGKSFINASGNTVEVSGSTSAYSPVDVVSVNLYLQQWNASKEKWVNVIDMGEFSDYNSTFVKGGKSVRVPSGYLYRTRSLHWINEWGTIEQEYSYTSYIYVD